jgi:hypothetical protein
MTKSLRLEIYKFVYPDELLAVPVKANMVYSIHFDIVDMYRSYMFVGGDAVTRGIARLWLWQAGA